MSEPNVGAGRGSSIAPKSTGSPTAAEERPGSPGATGAERMAEEEVLGQWAVIGDERPVPGDPATWSPEIQTSDGIRRAQPAASCAGESYADERSSITPGRARTAATFGWSNEIGSSEPSMNNP